VELVGDEHLDVLTVERADGLRRPVVGEKGGEQASRFDVATDGLVRRALPRPTAARRPHD
ncbi:MAG: hypothetical protein ACRD12_07260, partial [Acidimicrobiales bacterium]